MSRHLVPSNIRPPRQAKISAVIPARNEADVIAGTIRSLLAQDVPVPLSIVLVDDNSDDGTGDVARSEAARLESSERVIVIRGSQPPAGWTGKLWAVAQGVAKAELSQPDYILLTDADIVHGPDTISRLLAQSQSKAFDLTSVMVRLATQSFAEKLLIPAFVYFFLQLYPPGWISNPSRTIAGAAGGCMLIRTKVLQAIGGVESIAGEIIDDCALARRVKSHGGSVWLGLTTDTVSTRSYGGFEGVGRMISRSAFNQLNHSGILLALTLAGLFVTYVAPVTLLLSKGKVRRAIGAASVSLIGASYVPVVRLYNQPLATIVSLPFVAIFYAVATIHSAVSYWRGSGGKWKGRVQDGPRASRKPVKVSRGTT